MSSDGKKSKGIGLPSAAELYESEYKYWPWGGVIEYIREWILANASDGARVLDYMCGTGFLLHEMKTRRSDLECYGCSITPQYVHYAQQQYSEVLFQCVDARQYQAPKSPDIIICAAGLHHLPYSEQAPFVDKMAEELDSGKWLVIAEELLSQHHDEITRRRAVLELWNDMLKFIIAKDAPDEVVVAAVDVLKADLALDEFKMDRECLIRLLKPHFEIHTEKCIWPDTGESFGDFVFVCRRR